MYNPSKEEKQLCYNIVRELLNNDTENEKEYSKIVNEILLTDNICHWWRLWRKDIKGSCKYFDF